MVAALVLIGAPGSGKSSVLEALMTLLDAEGVEYGAIESEQLALGSPLLGGTAWTRQLDAVLRLQRESGRTRFLIVATVEDAAELRDVVAATAAEVKLVVCLEASAETVAARIAEREPERWHGKPRLIARARDLARTVPELAGIDLRLGTEGRSADEVARALCAAMRRCGVIPTARGTETRPGVPPRKV